MKKLFHLTYTDEDDVLQEEIVDETFKLSIFRKSYLDAKAEEFWINEAWEGIKIHTDIYIGIQPKINQRRKMDNPYYCKLGYTGLIYSATNSTSVSLVDRIKPYQYLFNIFSYRLETTVAMDQGKKMVMDIAQIPRSEGIDIERWMYYFKAMGIAFINSFEEGKKGPGQGKFSQFNQFQSIDMTMANTIQHYISLLDYIKQQIAYISGVSPQRLGAINNQELVGNVDHSIQQSALITQHLFDSHDEVKRRVYTALVECAKIAFKSGKKVQYVLDDMTIELLDIEELQFENSELNVYISNSNSDRNIVETLKQLSQSAMQADKIDLSTIIETMVNNNPRDIMRTIQRSEQAKYQRDKDSQDSQQQSQEKQIKMQLDEKQKDRDLKQYEIDQSNATKIQVQEIANYFKSAEIDSNENGIPDPMEIAEHALNREELSSSHFLEHSKIRQDKEMHDNEIALKEKELSTKRDIENKKLKITEKERASQELMQTKEHKLKEKEMAHKMQLEKLKLEIAKKKAAQSNKSKK